MMSTTSWIIRDQPVDFVRDASAGRDPLRDQLGNRHPAAHDGGRCVLTAFPRGWQSEKQLHDFLHH